jgi:site-specific DNA-methyltransferase (adenine-specific)
MKMFKYCWVWQKTRKTGFANAKKMPMRCVEDVVVFYKKMPTYNAQGLQKINKQVKNGKSVGGNTLRMDTKRSANKGALRTAGHNYIQEFTNYPNQILEIKSESKTVHPTQKPVALMEYLIKTYTNEGETVLDFTMGSGTTGVACKNLNRNFIGIELGPEYFKIAEKRINENI